MPKITTTEYWCDFNGVAKAHKAIFQLLGDNNLNSPCSCQKHLQQNLLQAFNEGLRRVQVVKVD